VPSRRRAWPTRAGGRRSSPPIPTWTSGRGKEGEKTLDTLRRVKEGREELKKWWRIKEEAQTIAEEYATGLDMEQGVGPSGTHPRFWEDNAETDLPTWAREDDPGDWTWARRMVCALVRWGCTLNETEEFYAHHIRQTLTGLLGHIEQAMARKEAKG
jgi:hypothetical protein